MADTGKKTIRPTWLPKDVPDILVETFLFNFTINYTPISDSEDAFLKQILSDPRMKNTWKKLTNLAKNKKQYTTGFLRRFFHEIYKIYQKSKISIDEAPSKQLKRFEQISLSSRRLHDLMYSRSVIHNFGMDILGEKEFYAKLLILEGLSKKVWKPLRIIDKPNDSRAVKIRKKSKHGVGQIYFVRELSILIKKEFSKFHHQAVADITNAIFKDLGEQSIFTQSSVTNLIPDLKKQ